MYKSLKKTHIVARVAAVFCSLLILTGTLAPKIGASNVKTFGETVRVGYMLLDGFEEGDHGEVKSGYGYEYLQAVRNYTGWNYEYVYGTWDQLVLMLQRGEIDLLSHVAKTEDRLDTMLFGSEPQNLDTHYLFVCGDESGILADNPKSINGKKVGVINGDFRSRIFKNWCAENGIECELVIYDSAADMIENIHLDNVHAVSCSKATVSTALENWKSIIRFDDIPVYFAVSNDRPDILDDINYAQAQILSLNPYYGQELQKRYTSDSVTVVPELTSSESTWLKEAGYKLKVGYCDNSRPLAYTDRNGVLCGLIADYLDAISKSYGITFEIFSYEDGISLLEALQSGEVDIITPVGYSLGMAETAGVSVSDSLAVESLLAVFKNRNGLESGSIYNRIAVLKNSVTDKDYVKRYYPDAILIEADTMEEALEYVDTGVADSYLIRSSSYSWYKGEISLLNKLQIVSTENSGYVNMAIRTSDLTLLTILNKGITLLDDADVTAAIVAHNNVSNKATLKSVVMENPVTTAVIILASCMLIGLIFLMYRLVMEKKYMAELKKAKNEADILRREAERASKAKSTFLTSMSHDIRTPMNAILGMTTLAGKHINNHDYVKNCLSKVTLASEHLLTLINDILDINKIETGKLSLNPTVFSLADSIMNLANIGRHQLHEKDHKFEIRIHNIKNEYLFADELRINQVFINLLSNAIKYTPTGGRITIDVMEQEVHGDKDKVKIIYIIEDTGIGMTEEFQEHMYELFAMANRTTSSVSGSGVGLSICKQLVDLMNGTIECSSELNRGTRFTVTLELSVADRVTEELVLPPMKLLLVDDDKVFLSAAAETLRDLGLSPDSVDSGEEAVRVVGERHKENKDYPLIIVDWLMPGMDGIETTRALRRIVGEEVSIIVISAYEPEEIRDMALAAGANGFISKPLFRSNAFRSISDILGINAEDSAADTDPHGRVRGMKVLVAEDNDLNWEIARELLLMYGITSHRAENGRECLEMLESAAPGQYDAILMDIQMPVLGGYDTAIAIRNSKNESIKSIPIVAMTADAYTEDILRCIEVGMNAHVAKPIDMAKLLEVLGEIRA